MKEKVDFFFKLSTHANPLKIILAETDNPRCLFKTYATSNEGLDLSQFRFDEKSSEELQPWWKGQFQRIAPDKG